MGFGNVGRVWTPISLQEYLKGLTPSDRWKGVALHHTWQPSLESRQEGWKLVYVQNLRSFYRDQLGWSSGPHLFTDEDQIFGMCPLNEKGIHAKSFNAHYLGIEALGNYDSEDPTSGRGLRVWKTTAQTTAVLLEWLKLPADNTTVKFHREDPKTDKTCPGTKVKKDQILAMIQQYLNAGLDGSAVEHWDVVLKRHNNEKWSQVQTRAGRVFVPVAAFLGKHGVSQAEIIANLKRRDGGFFYGPSDLELAFPDAGGTTWAPIREVAAVLNLTVGVSGRVVTVG